MWTSEIPTQPAYYWWRLSQGVSPKVREIKKDSRGLYCVGSELITLDQIGGQWQPVASPVETKPLIGVGPNLKHVWHGTYFHGTLEAAIEAGDHGEYIDPDIVTSNVPREEALTEEGCYDFMFDGKLVKGFIFNSIFGMRGILVDPEDSNSMEYGAGVLKQKPNIL